jgi:hypothetical protein
MSSMVIRLSSVLPAPVAALVAAEIEQSLYGQKLFLSERRVFTRRAGTLWECRERGNPTAGPVRCLHACR